MNRKLLDFDGIILICPYIIRHLVILQNFLASIMQYQLLSRQIMHLTHLVIIMTVQTVCLTFTTLLIFTTLLYDRIVYGLSSCADSFIPKFWWDQELDLLKEKSINFKKIWKLAGKPHAGSIYTHTHKLDKLAYKLRYHEGFDSEKLSFSNILHEALSHKSENDFWNSWRLKFGTDLLK